MTSLCSTNYQPIVLWGRMQLHFKTASNLIPMCRAGSICSEILISYHRRTPRHSLHQRLQYRASIFITPEITLSCLDFHCTGDYNNVPRHSLCQRYNIVPRLPLHQSLQYRASTLTAPEIIISSIDIHCTTDYNIVPERSLRAS